MRACTAAAAVTLVAAAGTVLAADAGAPAKAQACAVCHGPLGVANAPDTPHLAGQPASYLAAQLRAFRSGARKHEVMTLIAKPLTDDDIAQLAAWYAAIRIEASPPR
ncbi:MAG TPA: cytochrome c [Ideonella sp.]|jgi:cytochrome c553|nr:cytochrome c [Ideonella sp.]